MLGLRMQRKGLTVTNLFKLRSTITAAKVAFQPCSLSLTGLSMRCKTRDLGTSLIKYEEVKSEPAHGRTQGRVVTLYQGPIVPKPIKLILDKRKF